MVLKREGRGFAGSRDWPFERKMSLLSSALITPIFPRDSIFREIAVSLLRRVQKSSSWSPKRQKIIMDREIKLAFSLFSFWNWDVCQRLLQSERVPPLPTPSSPHWIQRAIFRFHNATSTSMNKQCSIIRNKFSSSLGKCPFTSWKAMGKCSFLCKTMPTFLSQESHD